MNKNEEIPQGWIYLGDENVRYYLGQPGYRNMLVFGANPSTASPGEENLDPTIRKVRKLCANAGYDGWIMVEEDSDKAKVDPDAVTLANGKYVAGLRG